MYYTYIPARRVYIVGIVERVSEVALEVIDLSCSRGISPSKR